MTSLEYITCSDVDKKEHCLQHLDGLLYVDMMDTTKYLLSGNVLVQYDSYNGCKIENPTNCLNNPIPVEASVAQGILNRLTASKNVQATIIKKRV